LTMENFLRLTSPILADIPAVKKAFDLHNEARLILKVGISEKLTT